MLIETLQDIVGPGGWTTDPQEMAPKLVDWRQAVRGQAAMVVSPASTSEVAAVVRACAEAHTAIVPQGGNTGMCAAAIPDDSGQQVILSLERMNAIRLVDADNFSMEVEAGCILANAQRAARDNDRVLGLSLGAEGSCQIGGNLATNAGGINVIRYGTARAQVLGLEVVLADGTVIDGLRSLRKDTAGYDLKQLFVGSEGTLGIITAATLKLYPNQGPKTTALLALPTSGNSVRLLASLRTSLGDSIEAFELMSGHIFGLLKKHIPGSSLPFEEHYPWYVLAEITGQVNNESLEAILSDALEDKLICDAVIAKNDSEAESLWRMRHSIAEAERAAGKAQKHDISVPASRIEEFLSRGDALLAKLAPGAQLIAFGHVGDGNLHYNVALPSASEDGEPVTRAIYDLVTEMGGSISAEHGIGTVKKHYLSMYRSEPELTLMRTLKTALDPLNILNPGKVI